MRAVSVASSVKDEGEDELRKEVAELRQNNHSLRAQVSSLEDKYNQKVEKMNRLETDLRHKFATRISSLEEEVYRLLNENEQLLLKSETKRPEMAKQDSNHERELSGLREEKQELEKQLRKCKGKVESLEREVVDLRMAKEELGQRPVSPQVPYFDAEDRLRTISTLE